MIAIINYGVGNLKAFANSFDHLNIPYKFASTINDLKNAKKLILPGVGSFDNAMAMFEKSGMKDHIETMVLNEETPILGVCVGMQMFAESSEEGNLPGLGWIKGKVRKMKVANLPLPHMGWNTLIQLKESPLLSNLHSSNRFYFLHSFCFDCTNKNNIIATSNYQESFPSVIQNNNIYGIQPHPEKSHSDGLNLLKTFGSLSC